MNRLLQLSLVFFLFITNAFHVSAQEENHLRKCNELCQEVWDLSDKATEILRFSDGATNREEVRKQCYDALLVLDEMDLKLQETTYQADDALYEAKQAGNQKLKSSIYKIKAELKESGKLIAGCREYLQLALDESNSAALEQQLFSGFERLQDCRLALKRAQRYLKSALK